MTRPDTLTLLTAATLALALTAGPAAAQTDGQTDESEEQVHEAVTDQDPATQPEVDVEDRTDAEPEDADAGMGEPVDPEDGAADPPTAEETAGEAGAAPDLSGLSAGTPVATIDDKTLTLGELIALRRDLPEQYQALPDEVLMQGLTEQMVDQTLLAAAAREAGLDERRDVALSLQNQERAVLADAYLRDEMAKRVTADALREAYETQYVEADPVEEIRASHILVDSEEKANALRDQLDEGADFAELAEEHGTDGTASRGGDLGWFARGDMVPSFGDAAFQLQAGEIGGPVESPYGWHVIRVEDRRERPVPEFEEVQDALLEQVTRDAQTAIVEELRQGAEIDIAQPAPPPAAIREDALVENPE